jgi:hypothetical protein
MPWLSDIKAFLVTAGVTWPISIQSTPASRNDVFTLYESAGRTTSQTYDNPLAVEKPTLQVMARSNDVASATDQCLIAYQALAYVRNQTIGGYQVMSASPRQPPFFAGRDEYDRAMIEFMVDFDRNG